VLEYKISLCEHLNNFYIVIWLCMLLEDVFEILPLLMPKILIDQFVFAWGHEQCITTMGQLTLSIYYYLKDLDQVHFACRGLLYGDMIKHYSLMMSLAKPFEIQIRVDFSLNHLEDMSYLKTRYNG